jgi:excisionase family DNA binding protein
VRQSTFSYAEVVSDEGLVLYTSAEVAELLRLNLQVVQRKLQAGEIPGYRIGREWRVERGQLLDWLDRHSNQRADPTSAWFDREGRLKSVPAKRSLRRPVLARLAEAFEPARTYREQEVSAILRGFHPDVASLRREMVAEGLFVRSRDGIYKLTSQHFQAR